MKLLLTLACLAVLFCVTVCAKPAEQSAGGRDQRFRRGFKNAGLSTARGFGKRASKAWDATTFDEEESFPLDMLISYLEKKPDMLRSILERQLDPDNDGQITAWEIIAAVKDQQAS